MPDPPAHMHHTDLDIEVTIINGALRVAYTAGTMSWRDDPHGAMMAFALLYQRYVRECRARGREPKSYADSLAFMRACGNVNGVLWG